MPRAFPPLTRAEVVAILSARGFEYVRTRGSHELWEHPELRGRRRAVTVDKGIDEFGTDLLKSMVSQSGLDREAFYCSTAVAARKINKRVQK